MSEYQCPSFEDGSAIVCGCTFGRIYTCCKHMPAGGWLGDTRLFVLRRTAAQANVPCYRRSLVRAVIPEGVLDRAACLVPQLG